MTDDRRERNADGTFRLAQIDEPTMLRLYVDERHSAQEVAETLGASVYAVRWRLKRLGVWRRAGTGGRIRRRSGAFNANWSGGRRLKRGYVIVRGPDGGEVYEHRLVAESMLGRPLSSREVVHHRNHDTTDNRPENLEVLPSQSEHMRAHMTPEEASRRGSRGGLARVARLAPAEIHAEMQRAHEAKRQKRQAVAP